MTKLAEALWKDDVDLEEALKLYVMSVGVFKDVRYFPEYTWSLRSLDRRLRHFGIFYKDEEVVVDNVRKKCSKS